MATLDKNEKWTGQTTAQSDPNLLPQAGNDTISGVNEDNKTGAGGTGIYTIPLSSLLANDKGGSAKTLYGADTVSAKGADIIVSADGQSITYNTLGKFDNLAAGEPATDTFTYTIRFANGATSKATVTVNIVGANDAPVVSGAVTGVATEDGTANVLDALANASDVDNGAVLSVVDVPAAANLPAGVTFDASTGEFTLDPSHAAYQSLAAGEKKTVTVNYGVSDGTATTAASASWEITGVNEPATITQEIVVARFNTATLLSVNADGKITDTGISLRGDTYVYDASAGDIDADGDVDFLLSGDNGNGRIYLNNGDNTFSESGARFPGSFQTDNELADIDNDGDLDAVLMNSLGGSTLIYKNNEAAGFSLTQRIDDGTKDGSYSNNYSVEFADLNGDNFVDAVFSGLGSKIYLNDGSGNFVDNGQVRSSEHLIDSSIGDIDGDGDKDLVFGAHNDIGAGNGGVFLNDGNGNFTPGQSAIGAAIGYPELADVEGDGDLDALFGSGPEGIQLWKNDGTGSFAFAATIGEGSVTDISTFDFDTDGDVDFAARGEFGVMTYENDGTGVFAVADTYAMSLAFRVETGDLLT